MSLEGAKSLSPELHQVPYKQRDLQGHMQAVHYCNNSPPPKGSGGSHLKFKTTEMLISMTSGFRYTRDSNNRQQSVAEYRRLREYLIFGEYMVPTTIHHTFY